MHIICALDQNIIYCLSQCMMPLLLHWKFLSSTLVYCRLYRCSYQTPKWYSTKIIFQSYMYFVWKVYATPAANQCYIQQNSMTESTSKNFKSPHELRILFTRTWLTENLLRMDWFKRKSSAIPQKRTEFQIQSILTWHSLIHDWLISQSKFPPVIGPLIDMSHTKPFQSDGCNFNAAGLETQPYLAFLNRPKMLYKFLSVLIVKFTVTQT